MSFLISRTIINNIFTFQPVPPLIKAEPSVSSEEAAEEYLKGTDPTGGSTEF